MSTLDHDVRCKMCGVYVVGAFEGKSKLFTAANLLVSCFFTGELSRFDNGRSVGCCNKLVPPYECCCTWEQYFDEIEKKSSVLNAFWKLLLHPSSPYFIFSPRTRAIGTAALLPVHFKCY